ncbi:hypothetical protein J6590_071420, partial [Homalodisca vitripennis]
LQYSLYNTAMRHSGTSSNPAAWEFCVDESAVLFLYLSVSVSFSRDIVSHRNSPLGTARVSIILKILFVP